MPAEARPPGCIRRAAAAIAAIAFIAAIGKVRTTVARTAEGHGP